MSGTPGKGGSPPIGRPPRGRVTAQRRNGNGIAVAWSAIVVRSWQWKQPRGRGGGGARTRGTPWAGTTPRPCGHVTAACGILRSGGAHSRQTHGRAHSAQRRACRRVRVACVNAPGGIVSTESLGASRQGESETHNESEEQPKKALSSRQSKPEPERRELTAGGAAAARVPAPRPCRLGLPAQRARALGPAARRRGRAHTRRRGLVWFRLTHRGGQLPSQTVTQTQSARVSVVVSMD